MLGAFEDIGKIGRNYGIGLSSLPIRSSRPLRISSRIIAPLSLSPCLPVSRAAPAEQIPTRSTLIL